MDEIDRLWKQYEDFKETAEQYMFPAILVFDKQLVPAYRDLQEHYTAGHAITFKHALLGCMRYLGIEAEE